LQFVALNDDTFNASVPSSQIWQSFPLETDPVLYAGLSQGDYYLVVSSSGNQPDPLAPPVAFDPNMQISSAWGGFGTSGGGYVLNVLLRADNVAPQVLGVTPLDSGTVDGTPTQFIVQFNETVNLQQLAFAAFQGQLDSVYLEDINEN